MKGIKTEIYSRVSGYYRPVNQWNKGKQEEFADRKLLNIPEEVIYEQNTNCSAMLDGIVRGREHNPVVRMQELRSCNCEG
jgi:hypothetical protein